MSEDLGQISEISFRLNVEGSDPRLKSMKRGFIGQLTISKDGNDEEHFVKIKSRYTMKDGSIRYKCIPTKHSMEMVENEER